MLIYDLVMELVIRIGIYLVLILFILDMIYLVFFYFKLGSDFIFWSGKFFFVSV